MYALIEEKFLEENKEEAREETISNVGDEGKDQFTFNFQDEIDSIEVDNDEIIVSVNNDLGYFSFNIPLDSFLIEKVITEVIKRMNKMKSLLEALK